jgi:hypothetical protein
VTLLGQVIDGRTRARIGATDGYPFDVAFRAAYVTLRTRRGADTWTARLDGFQTRSRHPSPGEIDYHPGPLDPDETYSENGWSALAGWKHDLTSGQAILVELLQIDSKRVYLSAFGEAPKQNDTTLQIAYRRAF